MDKSSTGDDFSGLGGPETTDFGPPEPQILAESGRSVEDFDVADRPFARIYYVDLARDYPDIWTDDASLANYVRLLSMADTTWPVTPEIPRSVRRSMVERLVHSTLIKLLPPFGYAVKGFEVERSARSDQAKHAAEVKYARSTAASIPRSTPGGSANTRPDQTRPTPDLVPEDFIDERTLTPEERQTRYVARMEARTGVKL
jgi:hypothetical protein